MYIELITVILILLGSALVSRDRDVKLSAELDGIEIWSKFSSSSNNQGRSALVSS